MNTAPSRRATAVGASVLALSGCSALAPGDGFLEQSPRSMAKEAFTDMSKVTSLRLLGTQESNGDLGHLRVDLRVSETGCAGNLTTDDGRIEIVRNDEGAWFRAEERFWRTQAPTARQGVVAAKKYADSWIALEGKSAFDKLCGLDPILDAFELDEDDTESSILAGEVVQVDDQAAVPLTGHDGKERITAWVSVAPPHRVLKLAPVKDKGEPDVLLFDNFNEDFDAETPPADEIVTIPGS